MHIIDEIVSNFAKQSIIDYAYIEKPTNNILDDINLHLILNITLNEAIVKELSSVLSSEIKKNYYISYEENNNLYYHCVSEENFSIYVYFDNYIYDYKNKIVLYSNNFNEDLGKLTDSMLIDIINSKILILTNNLFNFSQNIGENDNIRAFITINKVIDNFISLVATFYLKNPHAHDFTYLKDVLPAKDYELVTKIITMVKIDNMVECSKLIIWYLDEFFGSLPINIACNISIDYYIYVKKIILNIK